MKITEMTVSDCKQMAELDKVCFSVPWSEQSFVEETKNTLATYLLAKENDKIIGYIGFWKVSGETQITNVAVLPEYRRHGIASLLIEKMLELCADTEQIILEVRKSNTGAVALYEKYNFENVGIRKRFYHDPDEDGITMIRRN